MKARLIVVLLAIARSVRERFPNQPASRTPGGSGLRPRMLQLPKQQLLHPEIVGISRRIVVSHVHVLLRRFEDERNALGARIGEQPLERLDTDLSVTDEHVAVAIRAQRAFAVVEVEEVRRLADLLLELI